jgi:hypothetical protein
MFRPAWNNPNDLEASGSGDRTQPPPTMLTEAFIAAHTEVLCQLLQDPTANGSTTATNATDAIEASTFQALFSRSAYPG